ncbi:MAG: LacI family DNA-binding transcriptional regulator [Pseudomonadota bacterium]
MRPTLVDVAKAASVSPATVDRVINDRPGASARTRAQVLEAARRLGYLSDSDVPISAALRVTFLLPQGTNAYIADLARQAREQAQFQRGIEVSIERPRALDPQGLADALVRCAEGADAIVMVALNHPSVREAMRALAGTSVMVLTLASDISDAPRDAFVGIDNGQAGRLAGYTLGRFLGRSPRGTVALFAGSLGYRGHQEREMGFRQVMTEDYPQLEVLELRESREDRAKAHGETLRLMEDHPDLVGIYNAGGATVGIAAALEDSGAAGRIAFIAHEVTAENKPYLLSGTVDAVIDQNARAQIRQIYQVLSAASQGHDYMPEPTQLRLILRENLPAV